MKKNLEKFGKKLTKDEMKKVSGGRKTCGGIPCDPGYLELNPCMCSYCIPYGYAGGGTCAFS